MRLSPFKHASTNIFVLHPSILIATTLPFPTRCLCYYTRSQKGQNPSDNAVNRGDPRTSPCTYTRCSACQRSIRHGCKCYSKNWGLSTRAQTTRARSECTAAVYCQIAIYIERVVRRFAIQKFSEMGRWYFSNEEIRHYLRVHL